MALDSKHSSVPRPLPKMICQINTPGKLEVWQKELEGHPDKVFSHYILQGLEQGFRVGFDYTSNLLPSKRNMLPAAQHREVVSGYLGEELALNSFPSQLPYNLGFIAATWG